MSQENMEVVRRVFEASARRDVDAVLALYDTDVEWIPARAHFEWRDEVFRGHQGLRRFFRDWRDAWGSDEYECRELIDAGHAVISVVTQRGVGRTSGLPLDRTLAGVWTVRDSKIVRAVWFLTRDEALNAAGLRE